MPTPLSGPGVGLPLPQFLYPSELFNAPYDAGTPDICLAAGQELPIPAGTWYVSIGMYCFLDWYDPVAQNWKLVAAGSWSGGPFYVKSDGFNYRVSNRLGCPIAGVVTNAGGTAYVQASTTIAVTGGGGSLWVPIVGGQLTGSVTSNGAGYGVAPMCIIPAPPGPTNNANGVGGIPAAGYVITPASGTIPSTGFTFTNPGAGYAVAPPPAPLLPNPTDPNISTGITLGTVTFSLTGTGSVCGILCTNPGAPLTNPNNITLTVSGAGTNASVSPVMLQTVTAASIVGTSTIGGASLGPLLITSVGGGYPTNSAFSNSPEALGLMGRVRPLQAQVALTSGAANGTLAATVGTILDGGLFYAAPTGVFLPFGGVIVSTTTLGITGSSSIAFTMGSRPDIVKLQPAP